MIKCLKTLFLRLFDPQTSVAVVVTAPGKSDEIAKALGEKGFEVERREIKVEDGNESESSEDEE